MKKNEYVSPEMEIVEVAMQGFLMVSSGDIGDNEKDPDRGREPFPGGNN